MAPRTSSIIRSPLLPGQGRHHRARVAHPTSWTLSEEGSSAFLFLQRSRSPLKIAHSCGLQLSAATHAAAITYKSVMASLVSSAPPTWLGRLCFIVGSCLLSEMQELVPSRWQESPLPTMLSSSNICLLKLFQCLYLMFGTKDLEARRWYDYDFFFNPSKRN